MLAILKRHEFLSFSKKHVEFKIICVIRKNHNLSTCNINFILI